MDKRKSKRIVIALCVLTLLAIAIGVGAVLISYSIKPSEVTETDELYDSDSNTDISILDTSEVIGTDTFVYEETLPAPVPLPELDDGNEVYLDMGVLVKLQVIEDSGGEDKVNEIFDTMFLLINEFADVAGYKINPQESLHSYTLTMRDQKENFRKQSHLPLKQKE